MSESAKTMRKRTQKVRFLVYVISSTATNMLYVGCTTQTLRERWRAHKKAALRGERNSYLQKALLQFPIDSFSINVIAEYETKEQMIEGEKLWMILLNTVWPNGLNAAIVTNVHTGWHHTEEAKRKIGLGNRGKKRTPEMLLAQSALNKGKRLTPEHRALLSKVRKGRKLPIEQVEALRKARTGLKKINGKMVRWHWTTDFGHDTVSHS